MRSREGLLEDYFQLKIKELGGLSWKWTPKGISGVPDQIVTFYNRVWLVEMKNADGKLRPSQKNTLPLMAQHHDVFVIYGHEQVDLFIEEELLPWKLEMTCTAQNAQQKECVPLVTKPVAVRHAIDALTVGTVLPQCCIPLLKFYPPSKESQLKRKSDS
jgi:hypothetical protein